MDTTGEKPAEPPSPFLVKMRSQFLFCYTLFCAFEAWFELQRILHERSSVQRDSMIWPYVAILLFGSLAILGLYNICFLKNPQSRLYLFRWMST